MPLAQISLEFNEENKDARVFERQSKSSSKQ